MQKQVISTAVCADDILFKETGFKSIFAIVNSTPKGIYSIIATPDTIAWTKWGIVQQSEEQMKKAKETNTIKEGESY